MISYASSDKGIIVKTNKDEYIAQKIILTLGPWIRESLPELAHYFSVYRQVLYWFKVHDRHEHYSPDRFPIFIFDFGHEAEFYGFPIVDTETGGLKIAKEEYLIDTSPEQVDRKVSAEEIDRMFMQAKEYLPNLKNECIKAISCLYTVTPDTKFVIDTHPQDKRIIIASPCSGHGFKHSAAIGEVLAELATTEKSSLDISSFSLQRFTK